MTELHTGTKTIPIGFVLHSMDVAGAEMLVAETIKRLGGKIAPVVFCLDSEGTARKELLSEDVPVVCFDRKPGLDFSVVRRMAREIASRRLSIVHAHQYAPFFYGALAAQFVRNRPRVLFTEHGRHYPDVVSLKRKLANRVLMDHLADHVSAVCEFSARSLSRHDGFRADRIEIIPNGVEPDHYRRCGRRCEAKTRLGLDPSTQHVVNVARFHPVKDHHTLLTAFAAVARDRTGVDLLLVGDGDLRANLESMVVNLGLEERVHLLGVRNDVADILAATDIFVLTSVSEAAPLTLLEAMASALPVVVTDVGGNSEIVQHERSGFLVPRGDTAAVAASLLQLIENPTFAHAMGQVGARRVIERYQLSSTIDQDYNLYLRQVRH